MTAATMTRCVNVESPAAFAADRPESAGEGSQTPEPMQPVHDRRVPAGADP